MTIVRAETFNEVQEIEGIFRQRSLVRAVSAALVLGLSLNAGIAHADAAKDKNDTSNTQDKPDVVAQADTNTQGTDTSAQTSPAKNQLDTVTVTANKRQESVQQVQTAVTTQTGAQLLDKDVGRSASEILNYVPNASAGTQQHGRPRWWIRGVGTGQQQWDLSNPVGFYQDDVYISNTTATGFPLFDLDRVEVLRGPQGTLWGKNTTGGAINVIAKAPSLDENAKDNYLKLDYGSFNDRIEEGAINGVILPERLAGRIAFHQEDEAGPFHDVYQNTKAGGFADGAIRGELLGIISDNLEAQLNVHYRKYTTTGAITTTESYAANGVYQNGYVPSGDPRDVSTNAPAWSNVEQTGASLNIKWQLGRYALTAITGYEQFYNESVGDGDNTPLEGSRSHTNGKSSQISQEIRLASPREDRWNWLGGIHLFNELIQYDTQSAILAGVPSAGNGAAATARSYAGTTLDHHDKSYAIFGSSTYNFTDRLDGTVGLRWTNETKNYDLNGLASSTTGASSNFSNLASWWNSYTGTYAAPGTLASNTFSADSSKTWSVFTYDGTVGYKLTDTQRVYAKYAYGFKSGGFNTAATNLAGVNTVKPEKLRDYEIGYKSEWFDNRLTFNANAFYYNYKDVQVNVVGTVSGIPGTSTLTNAPKAHVKGAEFEVEALPITNLHTFANVGLLNSRYDDFPYLNAATGLPANNRGAQLVRSPHVTAQIGADYKIPLENGDHILIGGDARYVSKQYYFATIVQQSSGRYILSQPNYTLANFRLEYATRDDKYTWSVYALNAFNKVYKNHALPGTATVANPTSGGDSVYWAPPRTVGVSLTARW